MEYAEIKALAIKLEHFITPEWAIKRVLEKEILTRDVIDPCVGTGVLAIHAARAGYDLLCYDIHDWGYPFTSVENFLQIPPERLGPNATVLMNPPFSLATQFVEKSFELGARKIVMFQRWAFKESAKRRPFFEKYPMARQYLLCDRAECWRYDLPVNEKGKHFDPETGKEMSSTPTAHGWFVWERGQEQTNPPTFSLYK